MTRVAVFKKQKRKCVEAISKIRNSNQNLGAFGPDLVSTFGTPPIFGGEGGVPLLGLAAVGGVGEAEVEGVAGAEGKEGIDGPDGAVGVFGVVVG